MASIRTRRQFLSQGICLGAGALAAGPLSRLLAMGAQGSKMRFGFVTYLWGQDWDLPTLIRNLEKTNVLGVELRTQHAHKVESNLNAAQRLEVKKRFDDSPVECIGMGTNFAFHYIEKDKLKKDMEGAKAYVKLSHDIGGTGVKVKPNDLPKGRTVDETTRQIGETLNELGKFAADYNQRIRVEVHGGCCHLPTMKKIMDVVTAPNVGLCWNCNGQDLEGQGIEYNFNLVKDRFGDTVHVRELDNKDYPYQKLLDMFVGMDYKGWILLEARGKVPDRVAALAHQRQLFTEMVAKAQASAGKGEKVKITDTGKTQRIELNGELFAEYCYKDVPRPLMFPVIGATGTPVMRHWPMSNVDPADSKDHPHHKGLWFDHGSVNGQDFWAESPESGKIVQDKFLEISSGDVGIIKTFNKWIAKDGTLVCTDTRTNRFGACDGGKFIDYEVTIHASEGKVVFGDTKEGSMGIRLAPTMREDKGGHIENSEGVKDGKTWGKRADWCDYYGPVQGKITGVAIFDHPSNPRHPTWWHVRTYGLFAANPFGVHYFEGKPAGTGDFTIEAGKSVTWKWRVYFHAGDTRQGKVAQAYAEYCR